jgi:peptide/nickel transport system permease protein
MTLATNAMTAPAPTVPATVPLRSRMRRALRRGGLVIGAAIVLTVVLVALAAPLIAPYSPYDQNLDIRTIPPSFLGGNHDHLLGTDQMGRDYLSRLIYGARVALIISVGAVALSSLIGITLGLLGGYFGGKVDTIVMFFVTVRLSLPLILVALAVVGLVGSTLLTIMAVLAGLLWDRFAVVVRSLTMQMREREFVLAARAAGCSNFRILTRDILPSLAAPIVVIATLEMANAILLEAALSFLGLGVKPPDPSWGSMIAEAKDFVFFEPWLINVPGFALFIFVVGINLLGDGLQDLLSARSRRL